MQPTPINLLQPITPAQQPSNNNNKPTAKLGATWADTSKINIDVDNLLAPRSPKAGPAPTINQLKSNPNSPAHKPQIPIMSPMNNFGGINNNMARQFSNQNSFLQ